MKVWIALAAVAATLAMPAQAGGQKGASTGMSFKECMRDLQGHQRWADRLGDPANADWWHAAYCDVDATGTGYVFYFSY